MEVYRITAEKNAYDITSSSGVQNRWNLDGQYVIYAGSSRALASLELIVNEGAVKTSLVYKMMVISVADEDDLTTQVFLADLPPDWRDTINPAVQRIGSEWYAKNKSLILKVPSAVVPKEYNYVINRNHPDFLKKVVLARVEDYFWDKRLLK